AGKYAFLSLEAACKDLFDGKIDAIVTAPINKDNIQSDQFKFPGHTEYLTEKFEGESLMLLTNENLKVGIATNHIPVSAIAKSLTVDKIFSKLKILNKSLVQDFAINSPRIAVLGLNPHAGDNGLIGKEEQEIIIPAINSAKSIGLQVFGPYPADGFFGSANYLKFDAILAMYHDQGLIPFKTLSFGEGVNFTAGLNIIRTSPDHGVAYDIAGKNCANEQSFRSAVYLAIDVFRNRQMDAEINENILKVSKSK
ncbi:MAG TPA: 4-hydroxythreonine-4-phosphate dehydrogenase PdxA, partial [Vicingus sp.]|nr:4-hydroxythreonine-4-phosphate dehydrogenase PdxA [Vicingus sp.]